MNCIWYISRLLMGLHIILGRLIISFDRDMTPYFYNDPRFLFASGSGSRFIEGI